MVHPIHMFHRHIEHAARLRMDRQENRIGLLPLFAQAFQHDLHHVIIAFCRPLQDLVKLTRTVKLARRVELIVKPEGVQKPPQHRVVVVAKALIFLKRIWHRGQRLVHMLGQHLLLRHIPRHFAHPVQVIRETDQLCRNVRDLFKGPLDHRGAQHLTKGADMRQARRPIARLKQHIALLWRCLGITFEHRARFFKRPGLACQSSVTKIRHVDHPFFAGRAPHVRRLGYSLLRPSGRVNILHCNTVFSRTTTHGRRSFPIAERTR